MSIVATRPAKDVEPEVCNDLVGIHVGRGARPSLDHVDDERLMVFPRHKLCAGPFYGGVTLAVQYA